MQRWGATRAPYRVCGGGSADVLPFSLKTSGITLLPSYGNKSDKPRGLGLTPVVKQVVPFAFTSQSRLTRSRVGRAAASRAVRCCKHLQIITEGHAVPEERSGGLPTDTLPSCDGSLRITGTLGGFSIASGYTPVVMKS